MGYVVAIDLLIVTLAWVATVFRFEAIVRSVRKGRSRFLRPWLFALTLSLFATFQVDFVHRAFDSLVGVNNLSWLISYLFGASAIYLICISFCDELPRWTSIYLLVTLALLIALFPLGPARAPETSEQDVPFNGFEYLFLIVFYIYATVVFISLPIPVCARAFRSEESFAIRWRTGVILLAMGLIVSLYFIKLTVWSLGFFFRRCRPWLISTISGLGSIDYAPHRRCIGLPGEISSPIQITTFTAMSLTSSTAGSCFPIG
jgi:hypothetical protein